jgi:hypothetical protein
MNLFFASLQQHIFQQPDYGSDRHNRQRLAAVVRVDSGDDCAEYNRRTADFTQSHFLLFLARQWNKLSYHVHNQTAQCNPYQWRMRRSAVESFSRRRHHKDCPLSL